MKPNLVEKTRQDYNKIARHFAATRRSPGELEKFRHFIKGGQRILDWGCGSGRLLSIIDQPVDYFGTDQSREMIKIAKQDHADKIKRGRAQFFCTARRAKKFPDDYFDLGCLIASLHHLPDARSRERVLKQVRQELKPGGRLIITVWNLASDWARAKYQHSWQKLGANDYLIPWKNPQGKLMAMRYYHHFTKTELQQLLKKSGFLIEEMYYSKGNERTTKSQARNLVAVARKPV